MVEAELAGVAVDGVVEGQAGAARDVVDESGAGFIGTYVGAASDVTVQVAVEEAPCQRKSIATTWKWRESGLMLRM